MKLSLMNSNNGRNLVRDADSARDAGQWTKAANLYAEFLQKTPKDFNITVQLANCLKEAGEYDRSLSIYQKALELSATDSDVYLQQGHALKLSDRKAESLASYKKAYQLDPRNQDALRELIALGDTANLGGPEAPSALDVKTIWLDITDLIEYAKHNKSLSGIQRVVANLASYAKKASIDGFRVIPVIPEYDRFRILATNPALVEALTLIFDTPGADRKLIDKAIHAIYASRYEVTPSANDVMVVAGAFWIYPHYDVIARLRLRGMRFGVFIHDLIQIKNPEYVHRDAVEVFQKKLVDILSVSDFVLANSEFVASEVRTYLRDKLNFEIPVKAVLLATELRGRVGRGTLIDQEIVDICKEEFVLCVCTIEVRKNHLYLVRIWEKLRAEFGDKIPKLVFVGKWGWDIDQLQRYLDKLGCIGDWLFVFNGISDDELEYLYERSLFTAYTSFAEGFGLPIGESLVHGKPCIASNTTSMPEVGGRFARYIDPFNLEEGYRAFRQILTERDDLNAWTKDIRDNFKPRTWERFCFDFYDEVTRYHHDLFGKDAQINCILPSERIIRGGDQALMAQANSKDKIVTFSAGRRSGWSYMESWGVWSVHRRATLEFRSNARPHSQVQIYMRVRCPPEAEAARLTVRCGKQETGLELTSTDKFTAFTGIANEDGLIRIDLVAHGRFITIGDRQCFIGLSALAYCQFDDPLARICVLEKVMLY